MPKVLLCIYSLRGFSIFYPASINRSVLVSFVRKRARSVAKRSGEEDGFFLFSSLHPFVNVSPVLLFVSRELDLVGDKRETKFYSSFAKENSRFDTLVLKGKVHFGVSLVRARGRFLVS